MENESAITRFERAFNDYLDENGATFIDAQRLFNDCANRRAMTEKARRDAANREIEKRAFEEQDRIDAERSAHLDSLRQQYRDAR
jgi:hypothetical protein